MLSRMIAWVAAVVPVMQQATCGVVIALGQERERRRARRRRAAAPARPSRWCAPSSRGGVPVFSRPMRKPERVERSPSPIGGRLADAAGRDARPRRDGSARAGMCRWSARRAPQANARPSAATTPATRPSSTTRSSTAASMTVEVRSVARARPAWPGGRACGRPARAARARPGPWRGSAGGTGCRRRRPRGPSGRRARRSRAPDGPCPARRWPDCRTSRRWSRACGSSSSGARAHARRGGRGLAAGMAAADHDDVKRAHQLELRGVSRETGEGCFT